MEAFLNNEEQAVLAKVCRQKTIAHGLVERGEAILGYKRLPNQSELSRQLGQKRGFIIRWIKRWKQKEAERKEFLEDYRQGAISQREYEKQLLPLLSDEQRSGVPAIFNAHQRQQLLSMACGSPADFGLPFSRWSHQLLSEQAQKQVLLSLHVT
jgi:hypothetical protein